MISFMNSLQLNITYKPSEIDTILDTIKNNIKFVRSKKDYLANVPCAFDIETTSFYNICNGHNEKAATMYCWAFGIDGYVIIGRTWSEFMGMMQKIEQKLDLNYGKRLIIYVHNLSYEFQFIRKYFAFEKVFCTKNRTPIYAITKTGLEFRCSYILSCLSLEKVGENLLKYKVQKLVGNLEYDKKRHCQTPLTQKEVDYVANDVRVVMAYIKEQIEQNGTIAHIPLTNTGYVRRYVRNNCFFEDGKPTKKSLKRYKYRELLNKLTIEDDEYRQLKRAFLGGFTHANPFYTDKIVKNLTSYDFTSAYPSVMLSEYFPMSKGEIVKIKNKEEFEKNLKCYCCLFDVRFTGLESHHIYDSYISRAKCTSIKSPYIVQNGRIVSAQEVTLTITEQDYIIIKKMYKWDKMEIANFRRYLKDFLPKDIILSILELYKGKTELKGVKGKEQEYQMKKGMLNSVYGMCVTDIVKDDIIYDGGQWKTEKANLSECIQEYNNSRNRFLFYPWGVWITAYARKNLFTGIFECNDDYVYADTDSIKIINAENHKEYFRNYNNFILQKIYRVLDYYNISRDAITPKTKDGKIKPMGVWDDDGHYVRFKTLGAKRYMTENDDGQINITVSGLNKQKTVPYLLDKYGGKVFENFTANLFVPGDYTGKMTHTYIDAPCDGVMIDYLGNVGQYHEESYIHLEKSDYDLSISEEYADYFRHLQGGLK